ncbi:MAG: extensin family protein [Hyphomicrobiaceae bacterium]
MPDSATASQADLTNFEIVHGREECMHLLQSISADVELLPPIKTDRCYVPAPVRLKSLGASSQVVFDPPVETNCRLMASLYRWNKTTLQPEARRRLGSQVSRIVGASAYACRNVYNLPTGNLSQHAFANAIDIGALELSNGRMLTVLKGWGPTARDIREAQKKLKAKAEMARTESDGSTKSPRTKTKYGELVVSLRVAKVSVSTKSSLAAKPQPSGTIPAKKDAILEPSRPTPTTLFLRSVFKGACGEFGTTLGPEANDVHRNHFHFDLNPTRSRPHCH